MIAVIDADVRVGVPYENGVDATTVRADTTKAHHKAWARILWDLAPKEFSVLKLEFRTQRVKRWSIWAGRSELRMVVSVAMSASKTAEAEMTGSTLPRRRCGLTESPWPTDGRRFEGRRLCFCFVFIRGHLQQHIDS